MSAREDILAAALDLSEGGSAPFSPSQLIQRARELGSNYETTTLRTNVVDVMCIDSSTHRYSDLRRVARGLYVLAEQAGESAGRVAPTRKPVDDHGRVRIPTNDEQQSTDHRAEWYWEGNVQSSIVAHLSTEGWSILRVADTHSREHGIDVQAKRRSTQLSVEVKGYPSSVYARGPKAGQPKLHNAAPKHVPTSATHS